MLLTKLLRHLEAKCCPHPGVKCTFLSPPQCLCLAHPRDTDSFHCESLGNGNLPQQNYQLSSHKHPGKHHRPRHIPNPPSYLAPEDCEEPKEDASPDCKLEPPH